ncbi:ABC transporter substrate-binding protein [uncultured Sphaerochaeta sp.]|uniref:ABC transporter substrate-binding protein n=1 Tax=uncultured Sphaerochaeta sp. TaxID=886478 RepID=UPI002A0A297A|nr:ABC transporter substrate-binding protein [uncultured Sphaerochaeta sp.]
MKRTLTKSCTVLVLASVLFVFASCSGKDETNTASIPTNKTTVSTAVDAKQLPELANQIIIGRLGDSAYLDPNAPTVGGSEVTVTQQIYEGLVTVNDDGTTIIPNLATDWTISDDGLTYTFNLKPNVKFSDGTPVTGADWIWSFLRARDLKTSSYRFIAEEIKDVQATDSQVIVTLSYPWAPFLADLCCFNMVVGSKSYFDKVGESAYQQNPLGTGPYRLKEWKKENYILLEANPYYHEEGLPKTKEIKFSVIPDDNTRLMQLQAGQIDIANDIPFTLINPIRADKKLAVEIFPSTQIRYLILNTTLAPFNDPKVREALSYGINKKEISDLVAGEYGAPVAALVSESEGKWHNSDLKVIEYNADKAKKMLSDAGYTAPIPFTISVYSGSAIYEQVATLLKSELDKAGFAVTIETLERASISQKYTTLSHQATILQWVDDITDPSGITGWTVDYDQCDAWYTGLKDQELEDLNKAASQELNESKRVEMYHEIQKQIYDNANVIPLFRNGFAYAYSKNISGLHVSPFSVFFAKNITKTK